MKILITGSAGRVGKAIYISLCANHQVLGLDWVPSSTSDIVASISDSDQIRAALTGVDALIHVAALHAPHVAHHSDASFESINVISTERLARLALDAGVKSFVFTSTTALYGAASTPAGKAGWIDEHSVPLPRTIYHRTKLQAEQLLERIALETGLSVTVIRMSRCFPEPAPIMAAYRLHRGVDVRDVADAHALAALAPVSGFRRFVISGSTPFLPGDAVALADNAPEVIHQRCPQLAWLFHRRGWSLPRTIDRVYCPGKAIRELHWRPSYAFDEIAHQLDRRSLEVLPPKAYQSIEE